MKRSLVLYLAMAVLFAGSAWAQFTLRSGITGLVTDATEAVVSGAKVELKDLDRNQSYNTTTNQAGLYSFANLTPSRYQVTVEQSGFKKAVSAVITLTGQNTARVDLALEVGQVTESIEVTSAVPLLQTEGAAVGQVVNKTFIESLPVMAGTFTALSALSPNISSFPKSNSGGTWATGGHQVVGGSEVIPGGGGDHGVYMNGTNINDNYMGSISYAPSLEAIAEVKIDVANFSASNGRDVSNMTITTKGGTADFHGAAFETFENSALNAWNPYPKSRILPGQKKNLLQRNQFGANLGGPIFIPKILETRDKAFFFFNYQRAQDNRAGADAVYRVPTAAERQGDFSAFLQRFPGDKNYIIYDPTSTIIEANGNSRRTPFANNTFTGAVNPNAREMMGIWPAPNGYVDPTNPRSLNNYRTSSGNRVKDYRIDSRVDYRIGQYDNVYVSYSRASGQDGYYGGLIPELPGQNVSNRSYVFTANYVHIFTAQLTNEFIFSRGKGMMDNLDAATYANMQLPNTLRNKFFKNLGQNKEDFGLQQIALGSGFQNVPSWGPNFTTWSNPTSQFSDNASWFRGSHSMKFGISWFKKTEVDLDMKDRIVTFSSQFTRSGSADGSLGGDAMASFLLGIPTSIRQRYYFGGGIPSTTFELPYGGGFFEDRWQLTPKLTLTLGLRGDLAAPVWSVFTVNQKERLGMGIMDFNYAGWQLKIAGRAADVPLDSVSPKKMNWAPRAALAYRMTKDLVLRASYGIFNTVGDTSFFWGRSTNAPNVAATDLFNNARYGVHDDLPYLKFSDIFPAQSSLDPGVYPVSTGTGTGYFTGTTSVQLSDRKTAMPYYQRYMFEVQKGLGQRSSLSLSYTGGQARKLYNLDNVNQAAYRTGWVSTSAYNAARPNPNLRFSDVRLVRNGYNSFYNAGTIKFQKELSQGLQWLTHYTWSKTVADPYNWLPAATGVSRGSDWQWNRKLGRGEAPFSHPHRFVSALTFQSPWGRSLPAIPRAVLAGWNLSAITIFESGNALAVTNGLTSARDNEPNMPNISGKANLPRGDRSIYHYFDTGVFSAPPQDVKGNAGNMILRGPGLNTWNMAVAKTFHPKEKVKIEFRVQAVNAMNHPMWTGLNTSYTNATGNTFGWITGGRDGRVVELFLKASF